VIIQLDNTGFSIPVALRSKAPCARNGRCPLQARERRSRALQERPWIVFSRWIVERAGATVDGPYFRKTAKHSLYYACIDPTRQIIPSSARPMPSASGRNGHQASETRSIR